MALEEGVQRKEEELLSLMGIFKNSFTQGVLNRETRRGWFHWPFGEIRLETIKIGLEDLL